jgi:hypothetical protein
VVDSGPLHKDQTTRTSVSGPHGIIVDPNPGGSQNADPDLNWLPPKTFYTSGTEIKESTNREKITQSYRILSDLHDLWIRTETKYLFQ